MPVFPIFYTLFGLLVGSFLNVCIYRLPRRESIMFPGSHCPHCGRSVRPYDNIPVLSFLLLRGRCRFCKEPISLRYPTVELLTGLSFYFCFFRWGFAAPTFLNSLFLSIIIILVFIDYRHQILPNMLTLPGLLMGILLSPFQEQIYYRDALSFALASALSADRYGAFLPWIGSILGALFGGGLLFSVGLAYQLVRKRQGLGMGDVKMIAMVGAFLGWRLALLTVFAGSFLGSLTGIFLMAFRGKDLQTKLAFGTYLGVGAALALFYGLPLIDWHTVAR